MREILTRGDRTLAPGALADGNDVQLRSLFRRLCQAWTEGDAETYGSCFTPDCDYVSFDGTRAQGRQPMVEAHDKLFRVVLFGTALVGEFESIRYLTEDVALLHANGSVLVAWRSELRRLATAAETLGLGWAARAGSEQR